MRKLPLFVLAAAAMSIVSVPTTAHAAVFQVGGAGNGMNGYVTSCSGQTGNLASLLNQLGMTKDGGNNFGCVTGLNCSGNSECGLGTECNGNTACASGQNCSGNENCGFGQSCTDNGGCGFGENCTGSRASFKLMR